MKWLAPVIVNLLTFVGDLHASADLADSAKVLRLVAAQLDAIQTIECKYKTCYRELSGPGIEMVDGMGVFSEWSWGIDRGNDLQYQRGGHEFDLTHLAHIKKHVYQEEWYAFDGKEFRTFVPLNKTGTIRAHDPGLFEGYRGPLHLIGWDLAINNLPTSLMELLATKKDRWQVAKIDGTNDWRLTLPLTEPKGNDRLEDFGDARMLEVEIDGSKSFVPRKLRIFNPNMSQTFFETEVKEFLEAVPGIWVPVFGFECQYYIKEEIPAGLTKEKYDALTFEEQIEIARKGIKMVPLFLGKHYYVVDKSSIRVNQHIDNAKFTIDFPDGSLVWNEIENKPITFGTRYPTANVGVPSRSMNWPLVLNITVVVVLAVLLVLSRRRAARIKRANA